MIRTELRELLADRQGLTKSELIHLLAKSTGLTKVETETVVDGLLSIVQEVLMIGKKVELRGFGSFMVRIRQPREARNPATQERVLLERRSVPVFKPSKTLRAIVDQSLEKL
jgi:nucleoid DNA-binding protein